MKRRKNVTIRQRQRFPASAASRQSFLSLLLLILSIIMQGSRSTTVRAYTRVELQYQQSMRSQLSSRFRFSLQQQSSSSSFIATAQLFNSKPYCWPSPYVKQLFDMQVPQGRCLGLALQADLSLQHQLDPAQLHASSHWIRTYLHPLEIDYGMRQVHPNTTISFLMGRLALRLALPPGSFENPMLKDEAGRPQLPRGYIGSISHKHAAACALVSAIADEQTFNNTILRRAALGVDMEVTKRESTCSIERKVLTEREREQLGSVKSLTVDEEVLLRFSMKESLYKAMHPFIGQYVHFREVEIQPLANGTSHIYFQLDSGAHERFHDATVHWQRQGDFFVSSASVQLKEGDDDEIL